MLAVAAAMLAARAVDLKHARAPRPHVARETCPVAARALDPGRNQGAKPQHPVPEAGVAAPVVGDRQRARRLPAPSRATATWTSECVSTPKKTGAPRSPTVSIEPLHLRIADAIRASSAVGMRRARL